MQRVIERILNLLAFLLTVDRPVTADEIRHTVKGYEQPSDEAFRRTFERDKDLLRTLGVPLAVRHTDVWEVELGYVIESDEYTFVAPDFTDEESSALLLAAETVRFGGETAGAGAILKLGGASRASYSAGISADLGHDLEQLGAMFESVVDRHIVTFRYRSSDRSVEPYGLLHRYGHWYLVGPERSDRTVVKAFRVDRMSNFLAQEGGEEFERPDSFDPAEALNELRSDLTGVPTALVRFDNDVLGVAMTRFMNAVVQESGPHSTVVSVPVESEAGFIGGVLSFDDRAVIEAPEHLRNRIIDHLRSTDEQ